MKEVLSSRLARVKGYRGVKRRNSDEVPGGAGSLRYAFKRART
jgi:hypothetical protein